MALQRGKYIGRESGGLWTRRPARLPLGTLTSWDVVILFTSIWQCEWFKCLVTKVNETSWSPAQSWNHLPIVLSCLRLLGLWAVGGVIQFAGVSWTFGLLRSVYDRQLTMHVCSQIPFSTIYTDLGIQWSYSKCNQYCTYRSYHSSSSYICKIYNLQPPRRYQDLADSGQCHHSASRHWAFRSGSSRSGWCGSCPCTVATLVWLTAVHSCF